MKLSVLCQVFRAVPGSPIDAAWHFALGPAREFLQEVREVNTSSHVVEVVPLPHHRMQMRVPVLVPFLAKHPDDAIASVWAPSQHLPFRHGDCQAKPFHEGFWCHPVATGDRDEPLPRVGGRKVVAVAGSNRNPRSSVGGWGMNRRPWSTKEEAIAWLKRCRRMQHTCSMPQVFKKVKS